MKVLARHRELGSLELFSVALFDAYCLPAKGKLTFKPRKSRQRLVHILPRQLPSYIGKVKNKPS